MLETLVFWAVHRHFDPSPQAVDESAAKRTALAFLTSALLKDHDDQIRTPTAPLPPLAGFVVPTVAIGYGIVIPRSCIAGWNELTLGFAATVLGACLTYWAGLRLVAATAEKDPTAKF